jgi:hypothetical protein
MDDRARGGGISDPEFHCELSTEKRSIVGNDAIIVVTSTKEWNADSVMSSRLRAGTRNCTGTDRRCTNIIFDRFSVSSLSRVHRLSIADGKDGHPPPDRVRAQMYGGNEE